MLLRNRITYPEYVSFLLFSTISTTKYLCYKFILGNILRPVLSEYTFLINNLNFEIYPKLFNKVTKTAP